MEEQTVLCCLSVRVGGERGGAEGQSLSRPLMKMTAMAKGQR